MLIALFLSVLSIVLAGNGSAGEKQRRCHDSKDFSFKDDFGDDSSMNSPNFVTLAVNLKGKTFPISPYIYGINNMKNSIIDPAFAREIGLPLIRWGGNDKTRYNWKTGFMNGCRDNYFKNYPANAGSMDSFIESNSNHNTDILFTLPTIGWMVNEPPNATDSSSWPCSFSRAKYKYTPIAGSYSDGHTRDSERPDCGSGVVGHDVDCHRDIFYADNDPSDTNFRVNSSWVRDLLRHIVDKFGRASEGSNVKLYALDNEPDLWHRAHADIRKEAISYDELVENSIEYAAVIKQIDRSAQVVGPVTADIRSIYNSPFDLQKNSKLDKAAHGNLTLFAYYLQRMKSASEKAGQRLLDVLTVNFYEQAPGIYSEKGSDDVSRLRMRSTRSLWDPSFTSESWLSTTGDWFDDDPYVKIELIPRLKKMIDANFPGTKLGITEYSFGGRNTASGAVAQAEVLGLLGKHEVYLASYWDIPWGPVVPFEKSVISFAWKMFRNFDGRGSKFGSLGLESTSNCTTSVSIYAATSGRNLTVIMLNKSPTVAYAELSIIGLNGYRRGKVYRFSGENVQSIVALPEVTIRNGRLQITLSGFSITTMLLQIPETG